ncbi:MAG TPA: response regulator [Polyangiaceae bacterium]|nr:response regulator [Polyangiaceae bacterium]
MAQQVAKTVLVVDDDDGVRESVAELLELEGFEVRTARNGREALEFLGSNPTPDLIVLDLMMPIMSGREFRDEQLRDGRLAGIPVVVVTASGGGRADAQAMQAAAYFVKPVNFDRFLETLRAVVQHAP